MARYAITYKCGHTTEMQLFGKSADRENKIAYYKTVDCPHCRAMAAQEQAVKMGLPKLTGSDKQIAWAHDIRMAAVANGEKLSAMGAKADSLKLMMDYLLSHTDASFWIDNNDDLATSSIMTFARFAADLYLANNK